jgi:hypothetical protein
MDRASVDTNSAEKAKESHFANGFFILKTQPSTAEFRLNRVGDGRDACPAVGCRFEFSAKTIQPLTNLLWEELEKL